jgi:hypothetical protein
MQTGRYTQTTASVGASLLGVGQRTVTQGGRELPFGSHHDSDDKPGSQYVVIMRPAH